ncbi:MAG: molybdopterin dinucleotide binding domain-containing protein [Gammaproteobacteria bacterium]|nr:molybdopterin dinucleotide binding domain-containing protein [Gammaproteobacteria bacterium]
MIVLDCLEGWTPEQANVVLPAATFAESDGTWVNYEGRAQRFYRVFPARADSAPAWHWLTRLAGAVGGEAAARLAGIEHVADVTAALAREHAVFAAAADAAPGSGPPAGMRVPRQPHRYSGRTAMHAHVSVHEPRVPADTESPLAFSMEGRQLHDPGALLPFSWSPGWNSNQSIYKFQAEAGGPLRGGPAGVRLDLARADSAPALDMPPTGGTDRPFQVVPLQEVFASDESSLHAAAVRQRAPAPYAVLAPADAERLDIAAGAGVRVSDGHGTASFAVRVDPAMEPGAVGLVDGMSAPLVLRLGLSVDVTADPDYLPPTDGVIARG